MLPRKSLYARRYWHWSIARKLCLAYDDIQLEALVLTDMSRLWVRKTVNLGHENFICTLKYVVSKLVTKLIFVD